MHVLIATFLTLTLMNRIGPYRVHRQIKDFTNAFNSFLQSDFEPPNSNPYPAAKNKVNIVYKTVAEPVRIEKTVRVPVVKEIPEPVAVYVPQPYPVEKNVYVPYKVYVKQFVPMIYRYPVEKILKVPVQAPMEHPVEAQDLELYKVPIDKRLISQVPTETPAYVKELREVPLVEEVPSEVPSNTKELRKVPPIAQVVPSTGKELREAPLIDQVPLKISSTAKELREVPFETKYSIRWPNSSNNVVSFPEQKVDTSPQGPVYTENSIPSSTSYTTENILPFGARISGPIDVNSIEKKSELPVKEFVQNSVNVEVAKPVPVVANESQVPESAGNTAKEESGNMTESRTVKSDEKIDSREKTGPIVFPTERSDADTR